MKIESIEEFKKRGGVVQILSPKERRNFESFKRDFFIKNSIKITALKKAKREIQK